MSQNNSIWEFLQISRSAYCMKINKFPTEKISI